MMALRLYRSTIGKKVVMAVTGLILFGFILVHMYGNLHTFEGPEKLNTYGAFLRTVGEPVFGYAQLLWVARVVLLSSVVLHIMAATQLTLISRASRPERYARKGTVQASYASRTMRWGGVIIFLFVIYHILHFTTGTLHPDYVEGDVYHNVITGFQVWYVALFYILTMLALGLHLYHGVWSMFQTLGANSPRYNRLLRGFATVMALAIVVGNISVPIAVLTGFLK